MTKTRAPLLSPTAKGTLAHALIFTSNNGRPYTKRYAKPSNPQSIPQHARRQMIGFLTAIWKTLTTYQKSLWADYNPLLNVSAYHNFLTHNARRWANFLGPELLPDTGLPDIPPVYSSRTVYKTPNCIRIRLEYSAKNFGWGTALHLSFTAYPPPTLSTIRSIAPFQALARSNHYLWNPQPATYYFTISNFTWPGYFNPQPNTIRVFYP